MAVAAERLDTRLGRRVDGAIAGRKKPLVLRDPVRPVPISARVETPRPQATSPTVPSTTTRDRPYFRKDVIGWRISRTLGTAEPIANRLL